MGSYSWSTDFPKGRSRRRTRRLRRRDIVALHDGLQDLVPRSDGLDAPAVHDRDEVDVPERRRTMGDDDHDAAALAHRQDRLIERFVAGAVEARIRLVED